MQYATLGKTGLKVSRLGFGTMRLPMKGDAVDRELAIPMIHRAFDAGVTYIDTAVGYCGGDSQRVVGEALKGRRERIVVSTKNHDYGRDEKTWWTNLENSLEHLQVETIDIYNTHGVSAKRLEEDVKPRVLGWLLKAREQGLIRHICTSFHDDNAGLLKVIDSGVYDCVTLQYNMLDRQLEEGIVHAREQDMGVVVMGPVGGGRLGQPNQALHDVFPGIDRIPELALRFVLCNPSVTLALSGMSTMQQVEENLAVASDTRTLTADEQGLITAQLDRLKQMADLYCTGCGYCLPCPEGVNIPRVFAIYNEARVYGLEQLSRNKYADWVKHAGPGNMRADACVDCGQCEEKCPQKIPIRRQLKQAHERLTQSDD